MEILDIVEVAAAVVSGSSVLALGLAKVFPKFAKFGPILSAVHKFLSALALNHDKPADPGPAKPAVAKVKLVRDAKGKVIGVRK